MKANEMQTIKETTESGVTDGDTYPDASFKSLVAFADEETSKPSIKVLTGPGLIDAHIASMLRFPMMATILAILNVIMAASATEYPGVFYVFAPHPRGTKKVTITLNLNATVLGGSFSTPSAYTRTIRVTPLYTLRSLPPCRLKANSKTRTEYSDEDTTFVQLTVSGSELAAKLDALTMAGEAFHDDSQIKVMEDLWNAGVKGINTAFGTRSLDLPTVGIIDPAHATNRLFGVSHEGKSVGPFAFSGSSGVYRWVVVKPWDADLGD